MKKNITIALDAMGGDYGPSVVVPAAFQALTEHPDLNVILVGDENILQTLVKRQNNHLKDRAQIQHASEVVGMDEPPAQALRFKKDSSMRVAINLVKEHIAEACVSAGNTGALMATAKFVLKTLPGIDRPAISALLPTLIPEKNVCVLDLGANVDSTAEQLFQFAAMGSVLAATVGSIKNPTVALLNIGEEDIKGNEQVKQTSKLLDAQKEINYMGYIEGDAIYKGIADVVVCDGFVGNVALKTSEGLAKLLAQYIKEAFTQNWLTKLSALAAMPVLKRVAKRLDPAHYNGASLLGLQGIVIKSHGGAKIPAFAHAIEVALIEVRNNVPERIHAEVALLLKKVAGN